jgi:hypothetical protein
MAAVVMVVMVVVVVPNCTVTDSKGSGTSLYFEGKELRIQACTRSSP